MVEIISRLFQPAQILDQFFFLERVFQDCLFYFIGAQSGYWRRIQSSQLPTHLFFNGVVGLFDQFLGYVSFRWIFDLSQFSLVLLPGTIHITVDAAVGLFAIKAPLHILN